MHTMYRLYNIIHVTGNIPNWFCIFGRPQHSKYSVTDELVAGIQTQLQSLAPCMFRACWTVELNIAAYDSVWSCQFLTIPGDTGGYKIYKDSLKEWLISGHAWETLHYHRFFCHMWASIVSTIWMYNTPWFSSDFPAIYPVLQRPSIANFLNGQEANHIW